MNTTLTKSKEEDRIPPIEVKQTNETNKRTEKYYSKMESRDFIISFILFFQQIVDIHFVFAISVS